MSSMTLAEWFLTLVATGAVPLVGIYLVILMECYYNKPIPNKKRSKKRGGHRNR